MKTWRIVTVSLLFLALTGSVACNPFGEDGEATSQQLVKAERGDLMVMVSGSGNTEVSEETRLAFGTAGKIERIYVDDTYEDEVRGGRQERTLILPTVAVGHNQGRLCWASHCRTSLKKTKKSQLKNLHLIFCIETLTFFQDKTEEKLGYIIDYMNENGDMTYADTYINTIFVDKSAWRNR